MNPLTQAQANTLVTPLWNYYEGGGFDSLAYAEKRAIRLQLQYLSVAIDNGRHNTPLWRETRTWVMWFMPLNQWPRLPQQAQRACGKI